MLGYKFDTEEEVIAAVKLCNAHYGIPVSPEATTQNWCEYFHHESEDDDFYYIVGEEPVLGEPVEFEI